MTTQRTVSIVDDDEQVRKSLSFLLRSAGFESQTYASAEELLASYDHNEQGCIILDVRLKGMGGLELQAELSARGSHPPVIVISGYADVPTVVKAVKNGAMDVLEKPLDDVALLAHVRTAVSRQEHKPKDDNRLTERIATLSRRQREVMKLLLNGKSSKEIARELGIRPKTLEKHRAGVLLKMEAENVVDLMRLVLTPTLPAELDAPSATSQAA